MLYNIVERFMHWQVNSYITKTRIFFFKCIWYAARMAGGNSRVYLTLPVFTVVGIAIWTWIGWYVWVWSIMMVFVAFSVMPKCLKYVKTISHKDWDRKIITSDPMVQTLSELWIIDIVYYRVKWELYAILYHYTRERERKR